MIESLFNPVSQSVQEQIDKRNAQRKQDNKDLIQVFNPNEPLPSNAHNAQTPSEPMQTSPELESPQLDSTNAQDSIIDSPSIETNPTNAQIPTTTYKPTGIAYFDNKMQDGKGFSFLDTFLAKNYLGIDLMAHINMNLNANIKNDTKLRNMTGFYKGIQNDMDAISAINDSFTSDLKSIDGIAGEAVNFAHKHFGIDRDQTAKDAMTKLEITKDKIANAIKLPNTTGTATREQVSKNIDSATSHHYNKRDGLLQYYDHILTNLNNKLRILYEAGDTERATALAQNIKEYQSIYDKYKSDLSQPQNRKRFTQSDFDRKANPYIAQWEQAKKRINILETPYNAQTPSEPVEKPDARE